MSDYVTYPGSLYDYTAGIYCGVLITESVMRKLAKLQARHLADVTRLLTDEADRGNVFPSGWTLHYPDGKQTAVHFIEDGRDIQERIHTARISNPPRHLPLVFVASSMGEAKAMADAHHAEVGAP